MTPSEQAKDNLKYLRNGFIWALKRVCLVLLIPIGGTLAGFLLINYFITFMVLLIVGIVLVLTILKARLDYWGDHGEYPKTGILAASKATNTGPK